MIDKPLVLIVDDSEDSCNLHSHLLHQQGYETLCTTDPEQAMSILTPEVTVALLDLHMPGKSGIDVLVELKSRAPHVSVVMVSAARHIPDVVQCMRIGAFSYITKPIDREELYLAVKQADHVARMQLENASLKLSLPMPQCAPPFFGPSTTMKKLERYVQKIATIEAPALIIGEPGVGKSLAASHMHRIGQRSKGPLVSINCASMPAEITGQALFGAPALQGAPAHAHRIGRAEMAHGGTLLLEEVGALPLDVQSRVLDFMRSGSFVKGNGSTVKASVRAIATSSVDIGALCEQRKFIHELYHALNTFPLFIPPLRERTEDILPLSLHVFESLSGKAIPARKRFARDAQRALLDHIWPGNERELAVVINRALLLCEQPPLKAEHIFPFPSHLRGPGLLAPGAPLDAMPLWGYRIAEIERACIVQTLKRCRGRKNAAARNLGISEKSIYNKIKHYGISRNETT